jgi:hypothetical protein
MTVWQPYVLEVVSKPHLINFYFGMEPVASPKQHKMLSNVASTQLVTTRRMRSGGEFIMLIYGYSIYTVWPG